MLLRSSLPHACFQFMPRLPPSQMLPYINGRADDAYDITNALSRTLYVLVKAHLDELLTYVMKRSPMIIGAKEAAHRARQGVPQDEGAHPNPSGTAAQASH